MPPLSLHASWRDFGHRFNFTFILVAVIVVVVVVVEEEEEGRSLRYAGADAYGLWRTMATFYRRD
jgi:heme A synthase